MMLRFAKRNCLHNSENISHKLSDPCEHFRTKAQQRETSLSHKLGDKPLQKQMSHFKIVNKLQQDSEWQPYLQVKPSIFSLPLPFFLSVTCISPFSFLSPPFPLSISSLHSCQLTMTQEKVQLSCTENVNYKMFKNLLQIVSFVFHVISQVNTLCDTGTRRRGGDDDIWLTQGTFSGCECIITLQTNYGITYSIIHKCNCITQVQCCSKLNIILSFRTTLSTWL